MTTHIRMPKGMDLSLTYYLAGPMSGYPGYNYPAFERAEADLVAHGIKVASPHRNPWPGATPQGRRAEDPKVPSGEIGEPELWQFMMKSSLRQLLGSEGIILLRGWTESRGAVLEANIASALKYPQYFLDGEYLVAMSDGEAIK